MGGAVSAVQLRSNGVKPPKVRRLLDDGTIRVAIESTFRLAEARKSHKRAQDGLVQGKIVLTIG